MDLRAFGSHKPYIWTHDYLVKLITSGRNAILDDAILINAFKSVRRENFVPTRSIMHAYEDRPINIGYGEVLTRPSEVAMMLKLLNPRVGGVYLDLGAGTGYFATILAKSIGNTGKVYSLERIQWLWETCRNNLQKYPEMKNLEFLYRDGLDGLKEKAPYNGIHASFNFNTVDKKTLDSIKKQLKVGTGSMVYPAGDSIKVVRRIDVDNYIEEIFPGYLFDDPKEGLG